MSSLTKKQMLEKRRHIFCFCDAEGTNQHVLFFYLYDLVSYTKQLLFIRFFAVRFHQNFSILTRFSAH